MHINAPFHSLIAGAPQRSCNQRWAADVPDWSDSGVGFYFCLCKIPKVSTCLHKLGFSSSSPAMSFFQAMSQPKMGIAGAMPFSTYGAASIQLPFSLDHSKGQWFLPGEELPPGYIATAHPDGHSTPLKEHAMSSKARETLGLDTSFGVSPVSTAGEKSSKKSRRKKSSGCCWVVKWCAAWSRGLTKKRSRTVHHRTCGWILHVLLNVCWSFGCKCRKCCFQRIKTCLDHWMYQTERASLSHGTARFIQLLVVSIEVSS